MASEGSSARPKSDKVKFLDSKQAYVRAMNADGVTVIEGTGKSASSIHNCQLTTAQQLGVHNARLFRRRWTSWQKKMLKKV